MSLNQEENKPSEAERAQPPAPSPIPLSLKLGGFLLLLAGFAGPWVYGPLGKTQDWGWQPVWGLLLSFWGINLLIIFSAVSCFSYVELYYRLGRPPLAALLKWMGAFVVLIFLLPLGVWVLVDQSGRGPVQQNPEGALGWGVWLALAGLVLHVLGLRLQIKALKASPAPL
jgi:hypothetical protein